MSEFDLNITNIEDIIQLQNGDRFLLYGESFRLVRKYTYPNTALLYLWVLNENRQLNCIAFIQTIYNNTRILMERRFHNSLVNQLADGITYYGFV